jgi:hypothetical protein
MNGVSRDAGRYGSTRSDAASVHEFVQGVQAAELKKAVAGVAGAALGFALAYTAYGTKR